VPILMLLAVFALGALDVADVQGAVGSEEAAQVEN